MPLRCKDAAGADLHSFRMTESEWELLRKVNTALGHLVMPCCGERVVLKTSSRGTRFFAHRRRGPCFTKPESAEHLQIKSIMAQTIEACGWEVATEVRGSTPDGDVWIADIFATRGTAKVAVEIQWSPQTDEVTLARQARYDRSGVRCLWLFRQEQFVSSGGVPAVQVVQLEDGDFSIPTYRAETFPPARDDPRARKIRMRAHYSLEEFAEKVFAERMFWYGLLREGEMATVHLLGTTLRCWRCSETTTALVMLVSSTETSIQSFECSLAECGDVPDLINQLDLTALADRRVGKITKRYSKTENGRYLANGCFHCNALQGKHFLQPKNGHLVSLGVQKIRVTAALYKWLCKERGGEWHVDH